MDVWLRCSCDRHKEPTQQGEPNFSIAVWTAQAARGTWSQRGKAIHFSDVAVWTRDKPANARSEARAQVPRERCTTSYAN